MGLTVIHLSDIHIKTNSDKIFERIDKLCATCLSVIPNNSDVVIAISGDIAFSGESSQYELANELIIKISEKLSQEISARVHVLFVPGNHDCNLYADTSVRKVLVEAVNPDVDETYYSQVVAVQKNYAVFASLYDIETNIVLTKKELIVNDSKVLFVLINTAWMSVLKETPGKLVIPSNMLDDIDSDEYKAVFYVLHHPTNWLNPDYKTSFIENIRHNADIVLFGHEHSKDSYQQIGDTFSVYCNHGKELQDSESDSSAFSLMIFDDVFQNYKVVDCLWLNNNYTITNETTNQYHKNIASQHSVHNPNPKYMEYLTDIGISVNHFAKENVFLPDLFVWPYLKKLDYNNEKRNGVVIQTNIMTELLSTPISLLIGASSTGKTSIAKMIYLNSLSDNKCCLLIDGAEFTTSDPNNIKSTIEKHFVDQYSADLLNEFRLLPKNKKVVIVDNFDGVKSNKNRRSVIVDYLSENFGNSVLCMVSSIEITTILTSKTISTSQELFYYDILPLGNKKRKELITKWYYLNENNLSNDEVDERIEKSIQQINVLLGNGSSFVPALPIFIIGVLQNNDAMKPVYGSSKYAVLYESLILSTLSKISNKYVSSGEYNIDINILAELAFSMLSKKQTYFTELDLINVVDAFCKEKLFNISHSDIIRKMLTAQIIYHDTTEGEIYRFKYPYIFYYFSGRYIAFNLNKPQVKTELENMSSKLCIEAYGNIIIFVCHFSCSKEVIENILYNAYDTLNSYDTFDFTKSNPIFDEIHDAVEALIPKTVGDNETVSLNKEKSLERMDSAGINDGQVHQIETRINDEVTDQERELELSSVAASFKTIEVLGQILQNYPGDIAGSDKIDIIDEMHKLGMRSVQAIINTMGYIEQDLVEYIVDKTKEKHPKVQRDQIVASAKRFINYLISVAVRGMVHQIANSLNSIYVLPAAQKAFEGDLSISSKLVLMDLKLNCLNKPDYNEISGLMKVFNDSNERFAANILSSIVGYYLNYNKCDHTLRSKLCSLCGISEKHVLIENHNKQLT